MRLPVICGLIKRRLLVNFSVDADVMQRFLPTTFRPKLHNGYAIAGICLIRLEQIRPSGFPAFLGISNENAAHRIAVEWDDASGATVEGVFIPRRDTSSVLNHLAGGRIFPGEHHLAHFAVQDNGSEIALTMRARDAATSLSVRGVESNALPDSSCFNSLADSSDFFRGGSIGYSATRDSCRLDGIRLHTPNWHVRALHITHVESSFFTNQAIFPPGTITFDHALIMRDIIHEWSSVEDLHLSTPNTEQI